MQVTVRGWSRDMGARPILSADLAYDSLVENVDTYHKGETYFQIQRNVRELPRGGRKVGYAIKVSAHAELNLNGSYLVQLELDRDEVAKLFYSTNGDRGLPALLELFSTFKTRELFGAPIVQVERPTIKEQQVEADAYLGLNPTFFKKVDNLQLTVRAANSLKNANFVYIGDLVQMTEAEMLRTPNFVRTCLNEIKEKLVGMGLHLGMEVPGWPPQNVEELSKRFEGV